MRWRGRSPREILDCYVTERALLLFGWIWFLIYAFPGYMSYDSTWALMQARGVEPINDWQPPLMAFLWRYIDRIFSGPFAMLVIQSLLLLLGLHAILRRVMPGRAAAACAALVLIVPPDSIVMAVIWKDSQMAGCLMASIAALLSERRTVRAVGYVLLFVATGVRYNAVAATLPILLAFCARDIAPWWKRYAIAIAVWIAITGAAFFINGRLAERKMYPWHCGAAPMDIIGTIRFSPHIDDAWIFREMPGVTWTNPDKIQIRTRYVYNARNTFLETVEGPKALLQYPSTQQDRDAIANAWRAIVLAHPIAFLRHRIGVFALQLGVSPIGIWTGFVDSAPSEETLHYRAWHSNLQRKWALAMERNADSIWFSGWLYMLLGFALLPLCRRQRIAFVILVSGLLYELGLFALAPAIDYRYSHWMIVCTIVGVVMLFAARLQRGMRS